MTEDAGIEEKVRAVLSERRSRKRTELITALSEPELILLESRILQGLKGKPVGRLKSTFETIRLVRLLKASGRILSRMNSEQISERVWTIMTQRMERNSNRGLPI